MGLIYLWVAAIGLAILGFVFYYLLTGVTPVMFWQVIDGSTEQTIISILFLSAFMISILAIAKKIISRKFNG